MEKIIGGKKFNNNFPVRIHKKILWPCYEFIAEANGVEDFEKNIIEEVVLKLAEIKITDAKEIASCTGLEEDLISFIQSRLEQKELLDSCKCITKKGIEKLGEFSQTHSKEIRIYVDAVSGRVVPCFDLLDSDNRFKYSFGKEEPSANGDIFFTYKMISSAGTETDEKLSAYKLHYNENFNCVPAEEDVTEMLHKLFPKKDSVFATIDEKQSTRKNLRWILLDVIQPKGVSRDWVFTNGFGKISSFFSAEQITNAADNRYISSLREEKKVQTNAQTSVDIEKELDEKYPKLKEKLSSAQECINELSMSVNSPDNEEDLHSALEDSMLFLTQLAEWVLFYILHEGDAEYKAKDVLAYFEQFFKESKNDVNSKNSGFIIAGCAEKSCENLGFDFGLNEQKSLIQRYGKLFYAFNDIPVLFALVDILLIGFDEESWFKKFAKTHKDFITVLTELNLCRNESFHSGKVGEKKTAVERAEKAYREILDLLEAGLGVKVIDSKKLTFDEKLAIQNERNAAISRMEQSLGFALCRTLDANLIRFVTDMERRGTQAETLNNAIILDEYKILEHIFVSVNECLGNELKNSDWKKKIRSCGFEFAETGNEKKHFKSVLDTNGDKIEAALNRKKSSMNASCIAFFTLADEKLLKNVVKLWKTLAKDVSYIAKKRAHGEIPDKIDTERALLMKQKIIELIKFFAKNGFLTD